MGTVTDSPRACAAAIIDLCADSGIVEDYDLEVRENVVLRARIHLREGFVDIYRNFETGTTAYAWIVDDERIYGADNTGGWHRHPYQETEDHVDSEPVSLETFVEEVGAFIEKGTT